MAGGRHRHEGLNANAFFNNQTGLPVPRYRYNIAGFSIGGPVYVPRLFNTNKTKTFFFALTGIHPAIGQRCKPIPDHAHGVGTRRRFLA